MEGLLIYDHEYDVWVIWIGHNPHCVEENDQMEMMLGNQYLGIRITRDYRGEWNILIEELTTVTLRIYEVYKVRLTLFSFGKEALK